MSFIVARINLRCQLDLQWELLNRELLSSELGTCVLSSLERLGWSSAFADTR